eukprot:g457.t1
MGNTLLNATKRNLGISVNVQNDYSQIQLSELRECFNIWTTVLKEKERLDQAEFDEVFGLMLGDAESHFSILSHGMMQFDYDPVPKCDALSVFLALATIGRASSKQQVSKRTLILSRIATIYYILTRDDAPDRGILKDEVKNLIFRTLSGLCRLTGRPQPDGKLIFRLTKQIIDESKKSGSAKVTRKHVFDWLSGSRDAILFYDKCVEEIIGRGFDEFSGEILSSALFHGDKKADTSSSENGAYRVKGILGAMKVRQLVKSRTWSRKLFLTSKSTCIDALRMLQKNKVKYLPIFLSENEYNLPTYSTNNNSLDDDSMGYAPYPQCIGIVDYAKLIVSFLRVLSYNNVELPSEIREKDDGTEQTVSQVANEVIEEKDEGLNINHASDVEVKVTQRPEDNGRQKYDKEISIDETIRKISSVIVTIGRSWSKIVLSDVLPDKKSLFELGSSSVESEENAETAIIYHIFEALEGICEPFIEVVPEQPIYHLLEILSNPKIGRVPLVLSPASNDAFLSIIDSSEVLKHLFSQSGQVWGDIVWANVNRLGLLCKDFISVNLETTTIVSFHRMMIDSPISVIAVVNEDDKLISTLTASDFSCLTKHLLDNANTINAEFSDLLLPTIEFYTARNIATITVNTLFIDAMKLMVDNDLTSIFVVNEETKPIGYLNIKNIFKMTLRLHMN